MIDTGEVKNLTQRMAIYWTAYWTAIYVVQYVAITNKFLNTTFHLNFCFLLLVMLSNLFEDLLYLGLCICEHFALVVLEQVFTRLPT